MPLPQTRRVALLVETARSFGRELLGGISRYSHEHGPWSFHISPGDFEQVLPKMKQWGGDGVIARISDERIAKQLQELGLPTIAIGLNYLSTNNDWAPDILPDEAAIARHAADHLIDRGFRNLAYVGSPDRGWSAPRGEAFHRYLNGLGLEPSVYLPPARAQDLRWEREQTILADWIRSLDKPVGVFACDDDRGREVLEAAAIAGLRAPEDVAVVGVDNDEVFCDLSDPPLSSVALNAETAGYRAAELLDAMMSGRAADPPNLTVESLGVVARRSSEIAAFEDEDIAAALKIIHRNHGKDVSVGMIVDELAVSRRSLEKRFRAAMGRSLLEEVQKARLEHAKRLLIESTYSVSKVARHAGFGSVGYFIQFFQKHVGTTPGRFREELSR